MTTAAAPTRLIHGPWVGVDALPSSKPALDADVWSEITWQVSERLYLLSGRQWAGTAEATVVVDEPRPGCREWRRVRSQPLAPSIMLQPSASLMPAGGSAVGPRSWPLGPVGEGYVVVTLPDPPVTEVVSVTVDEVVFDNFVSWLPAGQVERRDGRPWSLDGSTQIVFRHGLAPPSGGVAAAVELAVEVGKRHVADQSCRLPRRVTNLQREGVTVTMVDPGEFLEKNRTGLLDVDAWIQSVNPHQMSRRAGVWSPDRPRTRRTS